MWLFLASLMMLFVAGLAGYVLIRVGTPNKPPLGFIHLPHALWLSTVLVVAASVTIHLAVQQVRRERQAQFRTMLLATLILAIGFVAVQAPSMIALLRVHHLYQGTAMALYGFIFFLVLLHALHVFGGIVALVRVTVMSRRGAYDHEHYTGVRHAAMYWHFLDLVWITLFGTFLILR